MKNAMGKVEEFEKGRFKEEIRRIRIKKGKGIRLNPEAEEFKREESGRYTAKLLYGWDDKKFDEEYLKKLQKNWNRWKKDREEGEREDYMKKLEENLEWNKKDKDTSRVIWGDNKEVPLEAEP